MYLCLNQRKIHKKNINNIHFKLNFYIFLFILSKLLNNLKKLKNNNYLIFFLFHHPPISFKNPPLLWTYNQTPVPTPNALIVTSTV